MDSLSGADNVSILTERGNVYNHVGLVLIYDQRTAPGGKVRFRDVLRHFEERLYLHPVFRQRLEEVPLGLDRPYWVAEGAIDIEFHVRHIALPQPGDWRQLMIQVARLHSRSLDRAHPLWEAYVIEGLDHIAGVPPGAFAVYIKIHHAAVDGMAAVQLITALHTKQPDGEALAVTPALIVDRMPPVPELAVSSARNALGRAGRAAGLLLQAGSRALEAWRESGEVAGLAPPAPKTRFSAKVSPHRVLEGFPLPIARIKAVSEKLPGITLNDVFLAVAGGAVRRYLAEAGELPDSSLNALMPISLRSDAAAGGNEVAGVPVALHTEVVDPVERLRAVHAAAVAAKEGAERLGLDFLKNLFEVLPGFATNLVVRRTMLPRINLTVSNVRGPDRPIYLAGARVIAMCPASIAADGVGLNLTAVSYDGVLWLSVVSCRDMLPDPAHFIECLRAEWEALLAAVNAQSAPKKKRGRPQPANDRKSKPGARAIERPADA